MIPNPAEKNALGDSIDFTHPSGSSTIRVPPHLVFEQDLETTEPVIAGWSFNVNEHGAIECRGNNICAKKTNSNHQVFQGSKPFTEVKDR